MKNMFAAGTNVTTGNSTLCLPVVTSALATLPAPKGSRYDVISRRRDVPGLFGKKSRD